MVRPPSAPVPGSQQGHTARPSRCPPSSAPSPQGCESPAPAAPAATSHLRVGRAPLPGRPPSPKHLPGLSAGNAAGHELRQPQAEICAWARSPGSRESPARAACLSFWR